MVAITALWVVTRMMDFINSLRLQVKGLVFSTISDLLVEELQIAENKLIWTIHQNSFPQEYETRMGSRERPINLMQQLRLFESEGLLQCRGRIQISNINDSAKITMYSFNTLTG